MANINANVMFKRGKQEDLNKYLASYTSADKKTAIDGAFYLTEDTNRLYVGKKLSNNEIKAVPVNQGVITVAAVRNLPAANTVEPGQFYYAEEENVLCIYSGSGRKAGWVQINPDTNTKITGKSYTGNLIDTNFVQITDVVS
jgi:hypothetical protein